MPCWIDRQWQRDSNQTASDKPGAVHLGDMVAAHMIVFVEGFLRQ
jgi:hypothetical protein